MSGSRRRRVLGGGGRDGSGAGGDDDDNDDDEGGEDADGAELLDASAIMMRHRSRRRGKGTSMCSSWCRAFLSALFGLELEG